MKCPKCYGKIDKVSKRCKSCGFNMREFNGATHKDVKRAKKEGFGCDVLYTSQLPPDISKKTLLLLCGFLGFFGAHSYYAGKILKGIYSTISFLSVSFFAILQISFGEMYNNMSIVGVWANSISCLLMGINIMLTLFDFIDIARNKYKVSVYKDEFSE